MHVDPVARGRHRRGLFGQQQQYRVALDSRAQSADEHIVTRRVDSDRELDRVDARLCPSNSDSLSVSAARFSSAPSIATLARSSAGLSSAAASAAFGSHRDYTTGGCDIFGHADSGNGRTSIRLERDFWALCFGTIRSRTSCDHLADADSDSTFSAKVKILSSRPNSAAPARTVRRWPRHSISIDFGIDSARRKPDFIAVGQIGKLGALEPRRDAAFPSIDQHLVEERINRALEIAEDKIAYRRFGFWDACRHGSILMPRRLRGRDARSESSVLNNRRRSIVMRHCGGHRQRALGFLARLEMTAVGLPYHGNDAPQS